MVPEKKPCGDVHPLPCGLDMSCQVPSGYYNSALDSEGAWELFQEDQNQTQSEEVSK